MGSNERGADLATKTVLGYGMSTDMAIQVKYHPGERNLNVLDQIEQAFEERDVDAGPLSHSQVSSLRAHTGN
jgi:hypothetical protein